MDMRVAADASGSEDQPWKLPEGWCWAAIDRVAPVNPTTTFDELAEDSDVPFVPMAAVSEESGAIDLSMKRPVAEVSKGYVRFQQGDVLFAKITPCMENGKVAPVPALQGGYAAGSTEFHVLRPIAVNQKFLWYWLVSRRFRHEAQRNMSGSAGQLRVPTAFLRESRMPLAPLPEQNRIVERIESLFAEIAEGEASLENARKGLETFRRALLKSAVTGELTRDWWENNQPNETGHDLLARIKAERDATPKSGRGKRAAASPPLDTSDLPELPEGWAWAMLGELGEIVGGATVDAKRKPVDPVTVPYLRVANVQRGHLNFTQIKEITVERTVAEKLLLKPGDILLNEGGDRDKIGRGWVWDGSIAGMIHQNHVFRVRLADAGLDPFFISHHANEMGRPFFVEQGKQTTNLASISLSKISRLPVPVPPPQEVNEIMRLVSERLREATEAADILNLEFTDAARLRQAILKSAFEGKLVSQDPADEPASVMLERLRQSSSAVEAGRRGRGKARREG